MTFRKYTLNCLFLSIVAMVMTIFPASGTWAGNIMFDLVSLGNDGSLPVSHYNGDRSKITPDGRYVVFGSGELKLVTPNTSGNQIFLRDRKLGTTELVSVNGQGQYGNSSSDWATISNDGCRVVFQSYSSNLVPSDTNGSPDIFLRDRCVSPMTTTRVNLNYNGTQSPAASYTPYLSGNGRYVAFNSYSTDLVQGVTGADFLYLRDLELNTTILISESVVHLGLGQPAYNPALSEDGKRVAFWSPSTELVTGVLASKNVFLYDANTVPPIRLVSSDANGTPQNFANGDGPYPGISADGHSVSFYSNATNLVANDTNNFYDVFVKNVDTNEIWRATVSSSGKEANDNTQFNSTLSQDGTWVTFWASASNLIDAGTLSRLVVLHNILTGETRRILGVDQEDQPKISGDLYGRFISNYCGEKLDARYNSAGVFVYDRHKLPVASAKIDASILQPVHSGDTVTLDGSNSNNTANVGFFEPKPTPSLTYTWTMTAGLSVALSNIHAIKPTFKVPAEGTYTFQLVVSDTVEDSLPSVVTVQVGSTSVTPNIKPIADAGSDQSGALVATVVALNGSQSSDPDGNPSALSFSWTQISGQSVNLINANTANPRFTPMLAGNYSFRLVVNDGQDSSIPSVVTIAVGNNTASNIPPVAFAGDDQAVIKGSFVTLDGSQSFDPDNSVPQLSFQWKQIGGSVVTLSGAATNTPSFKSSKVGSYSFKLIVTDEQKATSLPSVVTVTVKSGAVGNKLPIAVAGIAPGQLIVGAVVKLKGSNSYDPDRAPKKLLAYQWIQSDGPATVKLLAATTATPKFTVNQPGDYVFDLAVFDGADWSATESATVTIAGDIQVSTPQDGDIWTLGSSNAVLYQTTSITPSILLTPYVVWIDPDTGELIGIKLKKVKAKASGSFLVKIPNNGNYQTEGAIVLLCANDNFCGNSGIFSIQ